MVQAMIDKTLEEFGSIDILVSTAGISLPRMNSIDVTEADWGQDLRCQPEGQLLPGYGCCSRYEGQPRRRQDGHHLLAARHLRHGEHRSVQHHEGCGHGHGFARWLSTSRSSASRSTASLPAYVMTPMVEKVFADNPAQQEYVYSRTPSKVKMGSLQEMGRGHLLPLLACDQLHHRPDPSSSTAAGPSSSDPTARPGSDGPRDALRLSFQQTLFERGTNGRQDERGLHDQARGRRVGVRRRCADPPDQGRTKS